MFPTDIFGQPFLSREEVNQSNKEALQFCIRKYDELEKEIINIVRKDLYNNGYFPDETVGITIEDAIEAIKDKFNNG